MRITIRPNSLGSGLYMVGFHSVGNANSLAGTCTGRTCKTVTDCIDVQFVHFSLARQLDGIGFWCYAIQRTCYLFVNISILTKAGYSPFFEHLHSIFNIHEPTEMYNIHAVFSSRDCPDRSIDHETIAQHEVSVLPNSWSFIPLQDR